MLGALQLPSSFVGVAICVALLFGLLLLLAGIIKPPSRPRCPGPFLASFSCLWYAWNVWQGEFEKVNIKLHEKYGKLVRIGPRDYSFDDPEAVAQIYGIGSKFIKSDWYDAWGDSEQELSNLFALRKPDLHAKLRRRLAHVYSMSSLISYEPRVDDTIALFCAQLQKTKNQSVVNMARLLQFYAFDVIGEVTVSHIPSKETGLSLSEDKFSKRFGFLDSMVDVEGITRTIEDVGLVGTFCGIFRGSPILASLIHFKTINSHLETFSMRHISESMQAYRVKSEGPTLKVQHQAPILPAPVKVDMINKLLDVTSNDSDRGEADVIVSGAAASNIFAGSDTTSISLTSVLFQLLKHPASLSKLMQELAEAEGAGHISTPITFAESQKLPYLQAVIKESLRMHPAVGLPLWRQVPPGGATICGYKFPAGVNVGVNPWVIHYNERIFPMAHEFRPERWLESSNECRSKMESCFAAFGYGSRTCIGKNISLMEINKLIPELLRRFVFKLAGNDTEKLASSNRWFVKQHALDIYIQGKEFNHNG